MPCVPIFQFCLPKGITIFQLFFKRIFKCLNFSENLDLDICKISLRKKNLVNLKPLTLFSMEYVGLTKQLFGKCKMELGCKMGGLRLLPNFQKGGGGFTGSQFLEVGCWERGGDFFQVGCSFYIKDKLKSEIIIEKKSL